MPIPISDQVIVITGASSGIGLATAQEAARRGARVVLAARNESDLERAVEEIKREGGDAVAQPTDVTEHAQVETLAQRAVEEWGRIDSWVNNAAVAVYGTFDEIPLEDFKRVMDVILYGQVHGAKAALPHLERTDGALICVGSALSDRGIPLQSAYCAAKHALKGWIDSLRVELEHAGSRVRVTLVKPSSINTPLFNKARTYMGVHPMPVPPIYEPELAADGILRAAEGYERDLFIGGGGKALSVAERISPALLDLLMKRRGFSSQQTDWPKDLDAADNLYAPMEHDGGLHGDFLAQSKRDSRYQSMAAWAPRSALVGAAALVTGAALARTRSGTVLMGLGATAFAGKAVLGGGRGQAIARGVLPGG